MTQQVNKADDDYRKQLERLDDYTSVIFFLPPGVKFTLPEVW